jgi:hypothetical protein
MRAAMTALNLRIGVLGCPARPDVPWNRANLDRLRALGFNALQLNIAWGARPADEPLNLEDVVELPTAERESLGQPVALGSDQSPERVRARRADLRARIALCRSAGLRSIFHFDAPYNAHSRYGDAPPNCLLDGRTPERYERLIELFAAQFPGVEDLLLYTYDQDAWLCSEFGACPRCSGVPLDERVSAFVNRLARAWRRLSPAGRLWWEPWELSAGQSLACVERLDAACVGLALHSNVAEVMGTNPVDRWLRLSCRLARDAGLPVVVEHFLGSPSEELEPYLHIAYPQALLRALRSIAALSPDGIKEYYGLVPTQEDPNLRLTGLFFANPGIGEAEAMARLAEPYGRSAVGAIEFWKLTSGAMELFPWNASWYIREIGLSDPAHGMDAAFIRGQQAHTPSWESSRRTVFMKTDNLQPDAWMLEDVQLQCRLAAERAGCALEIGAETAGQVPAELAPDFRACLEDLRGFRQRALSYVHHLRETNLAAVMRSWRARDQDIPRLVRDEMLSVLAADRDNQGRQEPCTKAIDTLRSDPDRFLADYFRVPEAAAGREGSRGCFSVTSR